ncbi:hypothetical protein R5R35_000530 [Gryllus longicercus]|uniref:Uncharacterized protein n=1 Tax=Gryllus longicercus TaxID=2509291 RepID=A0AAN9VS72_9ORTH
MLQARLAQRKASAAAPLSGECTPASATQGSEDALAPAVEKGYPFALVLRLRVLQIVCGISVMVMGTVAFIEEGSELNLGLGIPAGAATVLAAAASIHTSRGFGGYEPSSCAPGSPWAALRFLGPSARVAAPLALLWGAACALHGALLVQAARTLATPLPAPDLAAPTADPAPAPDEPPASLPDAPPPRGAWTAAANAPLPQPQRDLVVLAAVQLTLAGLTIAVVLALLRVDCVYDPD